MDDIIRNAEDLKKAVEQAGLKDIPVFEVASLPELTEQEKQKIRLDAIRELRNGN